MSRYYDDELYHHGIKGQHWGVRRFQNPDGSLKAAGAKRYGVTVAKNTAAAMRMGVRRDGVTAESVKKNRPSTYSDPFSVLKKQSVGVKRSRADRAKQEAAIAHKLAGKYTNAMDRKAAKRQAQADANPKSGTKRDKANRAQQEAATAKKLAGKYTSAMDAKADKRQAQADEAAKGERKGLSDRQKTALKVGAAAVAVALAMPRDVSYKYRDRIYYTI